MAQLMLVNPRRKRKGRKRGRRAMTALQRKYFGPRKAKRRSGSRRRVAALRAAAAPVRRSRRRRHAGVTKSRRRSRRSGLGSIRGFSLSGISRDMIPAGIGAVGALGVDIALGYIKPMLPAGMTGPLIDPLVRLGGAMAVGFVAGKVMGKRFGEQAMAGALTVAMYDIVKGFVRQAAPGLLSEYVGGYYDDGGYDAIGYVSPAAQVGEYVGDYNTGGEYIPV